MPHLPCYVPGRRGRPRIWPARRIVEAILYLDRTGCGWRYLPADFPPWRNVPTAVIVTARDHLVPANRQLKLARAIPGASVHTVDALTPRA